MIKHTKLRTKWAKKLLTSKHFVILTDKESVIYFNGLQPDSFDDVLMLTAQAASLEDFRERIVAMQKEHERVAREVFNADLSRGGKSAKTKKATSANRTKIKVKG